MGTKQVSPQYTFTKNFLAFMNILVSVLIIVYAYRLIETEIGKAMLAFGYLTVTISTALKVAQKW